MAFALAMALGAFAALPVPAQVRPTIFQADSFGPITSAKADHAPTIQRALDEARRSGGGIVRLPAREIWVGVNASGTALNVPAGVELDLNGATLRLIENDLPAYQVVLFTGSGPAAVRGGTIIGDRNQHRGTTGEWGMCVSVRGASDVTIEAVKALDCWGDGIYVGGPLSGNAVAPSRRIEIKRVEAANNRRNNISIVAADGFLIADSRVHGAKGTLPEAGVDLEPNQGGQVVNGTIHNLTAERNGRYGLVLGGKRGTIRGVRIDGVQASENGGAGVWFQSATDVRATNVVSTRNAKEGLGLMRATGVMVQSYRGLDNGQTGGAADIVVRQSRNIAFSRVSVQPVKRARQVAGVDVSESTSVSIHEADIPPDRVAVPVRSDGKSDVFLGARSR